MEKGPLLKLKYPNLTLPTKSHYNKALMTAVKCRYLEGIKYFISIGADDIKGVFHEAQTRKFDDIINYITELGNI